MARVWPVRLLVMYLVTTTAVIHSVHSAKSGVVSSKTAGPRGESNSLATDSTAPENGVWRTDTSVDSGDSTSITGSCTSDEYSCLAAQLGESERLALEAIRTLHAQLDDDANGNIDLSESDEFLREELHYTGGHERRQKAFHRDDDMHISVRELWDIWTRSEVHNWTTDQTMEWLVHFVQLPQYTTHFQLHDVNGTKLPRLAVNNVQYMASVLGIKDPIHRQKIAVKAMDVVLFGPPRETSTYYKDLTLVTLLVAALAGGIYTYNTNRKSKKHLNKLMEHMEILSSAEKELQELQVKLQHAKQEQDITLSEKMQLERKLEQETRGSNNSLFNGDPMVELELRRLREEVDILRSELQRAEGELEDRLCWSPPPELQHWLQLTYELEQRVYNKKRLAAEKQLEQAKDACEKLNRKRSSFVASFVSTHGRTIDDVDKSILEARSSLMEVKQDLQERTTRWRQIESLCGFPIATNPGLNYLETLLRSGLGNSSRYVLLNPRPGTLEEDEEQHDTGSLVSSSAAAGPPVAAAASLLPYSDGGGRPKYPPRKYPLPKRESSVSLESASALLNSQLANGNGLSLHSNSTSELHKVLPMTTTTSTLQRQKLSQRENSKDSAFDGSTVSSVGGGDEIDPPIIPVQRSSVAAVAKQGVIHPATASPGSVHRSMAPTTTSSSLTAGHTPETGRKSPLLASKVSARLSQLPAKAPSHDLHDVPHPPAAANTFKSSQSDSALDVVFQQAQQQHQQHLDPHSLDQYHSSEAEHSAQEENHSTDSSLPSPDLENRIKAKKKQRFHFPSFVKRNKK